MLGSTAWPAPAGRHRLSLGAYLVVPAPTNAGTAWPFGQLCWPVGLLGGVALATLIRIGKLETPVVALNPTLFRRKSPLPVDTTNTGIADGAVTALSRMSRRATPRAA